MAVDTLVSKLILFVDDETSKVRTCKHHVITVKIALRHARHGDNTNDQPVVEVEFWPMSNIPDDHLFRLVADVCPPFWDRFVSRRIFISYWV